ncbi:MAG: FHA domain-containing protein [Deltaproteobacteria bacterium]|nr:FHA domain-containing protein [Deltaproteobacteria bacterium]MBW2497185.1 FHA domain-containing protein [Deltaproteobacteria bacterium]
MRVGRPRFWRPASPSRGLEKDPPARWPYSQGRASDAGAARALPGVPPRDADDPARTCGWDRDRVRSSAADHRTWRCGRCAHRCRLGLVRARALDADARGFGIRDLASTNGVRVNGAEVVSADLKHGDRILLGECELQYVVEERSKSHRIWSLETGD